MMHMGDNFSRLNSMDEVLTPDQKEVLDELGKVIEGTVIDQLDVETEDELNREIMRAEEIHAIKEDAEMDRALDAYENSRLQPEDL